jgi:hypothetical protein
VESEAGPMVATILVLLRGNGTRSSSVDFSSLSKNFTRKTHDFDGKGQNG